jgi:M6 family metalloprotease-like protein
MVSRVVWSCGIALCFLAAIPVNNSSAQGLHPRWEATGRDFRPNGAWRVKAGRVAALRRQLLANRSFSILNAPSGGLSAMATTVSGTLTVPVVLFGYSNTVASFMRDTSQYNAVLFGTSGGNPYTLRTYYDEMSNNQFHLAGKLMGWIVLAGPEANYTGANDCTGSPFGTTNCNGIWSAAANFALQNGLREALNAVDASVNWSQFDNDGPDGVPNTTDDDGYVDMIMFAHPTRDGACGVLPGAPPGTINNHVWSNRFFFVNSTQTAIQDYVTNDASGSGHFANVRISDYFVTSALGGSPPATAPGLSPCDTTQIMPIGTAAHEFGHALGLPDLYDTGFETAGIGSFGLMGAGNFSTSWSPSRMESWSLSEMGWITVAPLTTSGTYSLGAGTVSDSVFYVNVQGSNPRGEYFLIDNRQASQADTALIAILCARSGNPAGCGGGMLIWHVDQAQIANNGFNQTNEINAGPVHGLRLMQADGLAQLDDPNATGSRRRGDAGDFYPGTTTNRTFSPRTNPSPIKNVDGSFAGFAVDSIRQLVPGGEMAFRLRFGGLTTVKGSDTMAIVQVDGLNFNVFRDLLDNGTTHTVNIASPHLSSDGRRRFTFLSWSDAGLQSHSFTGSLSGSTLTANLSRAFKLIALATVDGSVSADTSIDLTGGTFLPEGRAVQLTATPGPGKSFYGWTGDVVSNNPVITVPMDRPFTVTANFAGALNTADVVAHLLGPTAPLSAPQIQFLDANGNNNGLFDIGDFLAWVKSTGAP